MSDTEDRAATIYQYAHLSEMSSEWAEVAHQHEEIQKLADALDSLPLQEFRRVPYKPPALPKNVPVPDRDLTIKEDMVVVRDGYAIAIRIYQPLDQKENHPLFFNIHGGGWTVGNAETEEAQNRFVASENRAVVVSFDYRKAPEFPFPFALQDSYDVLLWCIANADSLKIDKTRIVLGGGSAGANLAAALVRVLLDEDVPGVIGQILNIPVTCHPDHFPRDQYEYASYEQNSQAPIVNAARMRQFWTNYISDTTADPRANILLASSFSGLPPTLIQIAGMDPLRDEGLAYAEALKNAG